MNHPLTDEICNEIFKNNLQKSDDKYHEWQNRALRAAADWQLERDAEYFAQYLVKHFGLAPEVAELRAEWFKEAMRTQEDNQ